MAFLNSTIRNIEKNQEIIISEKQKKELEKLEKQQEQFFRNSLKTAKIEILQLLKEELSIAYNTYDFDYAFKYNNSLTNRQNIINKVLDFYDNTTKFELLPFLENNYIKINKQLYIIYKNDFLFQQEEASKKNTIDPSKNDNIKISDFLYYMFKTVIIILIFPFLILLFTIR